MIQPTTTTKCILASIFSNFVNTRTPPIAVTLKLEDVILIGRLSSLITDFIKQIDFDFKLNYDDTNLHAFFLDVEADLFKDNINWGRVIAFFRFAVEFAVMLNADKMVDSVLEWTCQTVEEKLETFYSTNNGWVSDVHNIKTELITGDLLLAERPW